MVSLLISASFKVALVMLLAADSSAAANSSKALQRCVYLNDKIERYTQLRRKGGSNAQMASWRRSRSRYEEEFHSARCRQFSHHLRRKKR